MIGYRLCQILLGSQLHFSGLGVLSQVIAGAISTANTLNPPLGTHTHTHMGTEDGAADTHI